MKKMSNGLRKCLNDNIYGVKAMQLFAHTISLLEKALDYSSLKQKVISQNIANADTPNYKAKDINFQAIFQDELRHSIEGKRTDERHIPIRSSISQPIRMTQKNIQYHHNGNSVDMDQEMAKLAENQIYYYSLVDRLNGKFQSLQSVIRGGK